jgi:predicted PP-loop superfamily ATPase
MGKKCEISIKIFIFGDLLHTGKGLIELISNDIIKP